MKLFFIISILFVSRSIFAADITTPIEFKTLPASQLQGEKINSIADLKNKIVIIDFWASWCEPCKEALPHYNNIYDTYKDKGVIVIGINEDDDIMERDNYLKKNKIHFPIFADPQKKQAGQFKVAALPTLFIIDKNLKPVAIYRGYNKDKLQQITNKIEELLKKK